jgi:hypothetical protein
VHIRSLGMAVERLGHKLGVAVLQLAYAPGAAVV